MKKQKKVLLFYWSQHRSFIKTNGIPENSKRSFGYLTKYLFRYKGLVIQLIVGLAAASLFSLLFPFLTQSIVDIGIQTQDLNFIYLMLLAQLMLFAGQTSIEVLRSWIMLHLSTRIHISLVSDFFIKLMKLPISYFDSRMTGDIMQRIGDNHRIEQLLTGSSLNVMFSLVNLVVFSFVLAFYNIQLFLVFLIGSIVYLGMDIIFLKKEKRVRLQAFLSSRK